MLYKSLSALESVIMVWPMIGKRSDTMGMGAQTSC